MTTCSLHPNYQATRPPTSTAEGCVCAEVYAERDPIGAALSAPGGPEDPAKAAAVAAQKIGRLEDDLRRAKSRADSAEKRMHEAERIRENVFGLTSQVIAAPDWAVERSAASGAPHIAVLVTSDFQWGEVINKDNMDGVNEFNVGIAQARYRKLVERTVDISFEHLSKNTYSGLIYLRLGDAVSGDIHQELRETNELGGVEAVKSLVEAETWGLGKLADAFRNVQVISVPGNHGRTSLKPPSKKVAETNLDTLSAWWLEREFKADPRLSFLTPNSTDALFDMHGRQYLATHGDNIGARGGEGFIGPAATIMRGMKKTMDEYARRHVDVERMFIGHFHSAFDLGRGWSNGCLPGYSEFARSFRMTPEPPQQWLIFFHPRYGATSQWRVIL